MLITAIALIVTGCGITGIAFSTTGPIYVADGINARIVRINNISGAGWTTFGSFGPGTNQFSEPSSVLVGP